MIIAYSSYYGDKGLQYNMLRTPIGGSDFSTYAYAFNELPENDEKLTNFSLTSQDFDYKVTNKDWLFGISIKCKAKLFSFEK